MIYRRILPELVFDIHQYMSNDGTLGRQKNLVIIYGNTKIHVYFPLPAFVRFLACGDVFCLLLACCSSKDLDFSMHFEALIREGVSYIRWLKSIFFVAKKLQGHHLMNSFYMLFHSLRFLPFGCSVMTLIFGLFFWSGKNSLSYSSLASEILSPNMLEAIYSFDLFLFGGPLQKRWSQI